MLGIQSSSSNIKLELTSTTDHFQKITTQLDLINEKSTKLLSGPDAKKHEINCAKENKFLGVLRPINNEIKGLVNSQKELKDKKKDLSNQYLESSAIASAGLLLVSAMATVAVALVVLLGCAIPLAIAGKIALFSALGYGIVGGAVFGSGLLLLGGKILSKIVAHHVNAKNALTQLNALPMLNSNYELKNAKEVHEVLQEVGQYLDKALNDAKDTDAVVRNNIQKNPLKGENGQFDAIAAENRARDQDARTQKINDLTEAKTSCDQLISAIKADENYSFIDLDAWE